MRQYVGMTVKGALGLAAALVMAGAVQASAALSPGCRQGEESLKITKIARGWAQPVKQGEGIRPLRLAQQGEMTPAKPKSAPAPEAKPRKMKKAAPPAPQMERSKSMQPEEDLERAGTRKLGGEVIRNKEE